MKHIIAFILILSGFGACNHLNQFGDNISSANSSKSHNAGQNCMNCHKKGGEGDGWFSIAGTAYRPDLATAQNAVINLYTAPNGGGELKKIVSGDLLGNFYTTDIQAFGTGLYPSVTYNGNTSYMSGSILHGACNSCHGISTDKIIVSQ